MKFVVERLQLLLAQYNFLIYNLITLLGNLFRIATEMWSSISNVYGQARTSSNYSCCICKFSHTITDKSALAWDCRLSRKQGKRSSQKSPFPDDRNYYLNSLTQSLRKLMFSFRNSHVAINSVHAIFFFLGKKKKSMWAKNYWKEANPNAFYL